MSDPDEVTIIVHSAKNLKGKKAGRHKFSVIFGLGITKFRTAVVKDSDGNPIWNEETVVPVSNILDQVFFIVTEKDDILGQITVPVAALKDTKGFVKRQVLQPHKKCPKPQGELAYQCYVSKHRAPGDRLPVLSHISNTPDEVRPQSAFQRLRKRMASPVAQRKSKTIEKEKEKETRDNKDKRGSLSSFNKKLSRSIQDLFSFGKLSAHDTIDLDDDSSESYKNNFNKLKNKKKFGINFRSVNDINTVGKDPEITRCLPNRGPIDQPTRLCIEGSNLGIGKSDILSLKIADCDCTDTVEFESSSRIYCTTHFWKVCCGPVEIDTISGGIGVLKNGFTFYEGMDANGNASTNPFDTDGEEDTMSEPQENTTFSLGGKQIKSGSNTLPKIRGSAIITDDAPPTPSTPSGRYRKKHARTSSESVMNTSKPPTPPVGRVDNVSKEELMAKIKKLEEENAALKKDNEGMKSYIDKLVAKCMLHCPEALAQDDDEKTKLFVL